MMSIMHHLIYTTKHSKTTVIFIKIQPDLQYTAVEVRTSSQVIYSYRPLHMAGQKQGDRLKPTYSSSEMIRGIAMRTSRKRWTIGRESGGSVLMAWQDDNDGDVVDRCVQKGFVRIFLKKSKLKYLTEAEWHKDTCFNI